MPGPREQGRTLPTMPIPRIKDPNALDGLLSLGLAGIGASLVFGLGWGLLTAGAMLFVSVTIDDLRRPRGA